MRADRPFAIDAWGLLPDHLHCIWTLPEGDADWMTASKRKHGESTIWQRRFWEHPIRNEEDFIWHADYIHFNPVKHCHVEHVREWPHSTFHRFVRDGMYGADWAGVVNIGRMPYD